MTSILPIMAAAIAVLAAIRGVWSPCGLSMISTINPVSERSRSHRYRVTASWFVTGAGCGGAILGGAALVGALAWNSLGIPPDISLTIGAGCCLVAAASDTSVLGWQLPLIPRQVNERWVDRYRQWFYASAFGVQIGLGLVTYVMTAAVYLTVALAVLSGSPQVALLVGVLFGLIRGAAIAVGSRADTPARLHRVHATLERLQPWSLRVVIVAEVVAAAALLWFSIGLWSVIAAGLGALAVLLRRPLRSALPVARGMSRVR